MKILVTGAQGFIGKNLVYALKNNGYCNVLEYTSKNDENDLKKYCKDCDFVFHLAGANRPKDVKDFYTINTNLTQKLVDYLQQGSKAPIVFASSIQAQLNNDYGISKLNAEKIIQNYSATTGTAVYVYRLTNVFGKWCKPNYNSVIATFCHNIANNLPIVINDKNTKLNLIYIDDLVREFINAIKGNAYKKDAFYTVPIIYTKTLGEIAEKIQEFSNCCNTLDIPNQYDLFNKKLYSTYLSYLPQEKFKYSLNMHCDARGSFTEFIKTLERGQVSINVSKPHIIKGNHWHNTKHEIFLVVKGCGVIRLRKPNSNQITEIFVSDKKLEPVIIPPGYTHNIENIADEDMVTVMWANEVFDKENPDTYFLEVKND